MNNVQQQHMNQKFERFKDVKIDESNIEQYIRNKSAKQKQTDMLYSILSSQVTIVTLAASIGILFNVGLVTSLCIPNTWSTFLPLLYSPNRIYFQGFIDIMYGMKFIGMNDVAALRKLYEQMILDKSKGDDTQTIIDPEQIVKSLFNTGKRNDDVEDTDTKKETSALDDKIKESSAYKFYSFIYETIKKKDIFNPTKKDATDQSLLEFIWSYYNSPYGQFITSAFNLTCNSYTWINTTKDLLSSYQDINALIIFESAFKNGMQSRTFNELINTTSITSIEGAKKLFNWITESGNKNNTDAGNFVSYMSNTVDIFKPITDKMPQFYSIALNGVYKATIKSTANAFFNNIKKTATKKSQETIKLTYEEQIKNIEQEVVLVSKYKKEAYSNDDIAELLNKSSPDQDDIRYKLGINRYIVDFKRKFTRFLRNPKHFTQNMMLFVNGWTVVSYFMYTMKTIMLSYTALFAQDMIIDGYSNKPIID